MSERNRCACETTRRLEDPLEPDARITLALEYLKQAHDHCFLTIEFKPRDARYQDAQAHHEGVMTQAARNQMICARVSVNSGMTALGETLRDASDPVRVSGLPEPWGTNIPPSFKWLQRALDELVASRDAFDQELADTRRI